MALAGFNRRLTGHSNALEYSHEDLACLVQHINEKRPHLKEALRFVALWNIKSGSYVKDSHPIFDKTTIQKIDNFARQEKGDYDFFDTCAQVTEALRQDEENLSHDKASGVAHSSIWEEKKWEWHVFQR